MQGDAISSGFACISRRFSAGLVELSQGKSTRKCRLRRRNCASGILETHSSQYEDDSCFFGWINAVKHQGQLQILRVDCVKWRVSRMQSFAKVLTSDHSFTIICERMVTDLDGGPGSDDDGIVNPTVHDEKNVMTRKMLAIEQFRDEWGQGAGQRALPDGADRDIHACLRGDDGQGIDQAGRHRDAGLRLYHTDLLADLPVRPGAGACGSDHRPDRGVLVGISSHYMERDKYEQQPNA